MAKKKINILTEVLTEKEAAQIVFNKLLQSNDLFKGKYDGGNGNENYMYGIRLVMKNIAYMISEECYKEFNIEFINNMIESEIKEGRCNCANND